MKERTGKVLAKLPVDVATFLLNEKRESIIETESRHGVHVIIVPSPHFQSPRYEIERIRDDDTEHDVHRQSSYELSSEVVEVPSFATDDQGARRADEPAVKTILPPAPVPAPAPAPAAAASGEPASGGLLGKLWSSLFGGGAAEPEEPRAEVETSRSRGRSDRSRGGSQRSGDRRRGQRRGSSGRRGHYRDLCGGTDTAGSDRCAAQTPHRCQPGLSHWR